MTRPRIIARRGWRKRASCDAIVVPRPSERYEYNLQKGFDGALEIGNGHFVAWKTDQEELWFWRADGMAAGIPIQAHDQGVLGVIKLRGDRALSWGADHTLQIWRNDGTRDGGCFDKHSASIRGARELRDGRILSWDAERQIEVWSSRGLHEGCSLSGHWGALLGVQELSDGRILSWAEDETIRIWRVDDPSRTDALTSWPLEARDPARASQPTHPYVWPTPSLVSARRRDLVSSTSIARLPTLATPEPSSRDNVDEEIVVTGSRLRDTAIQGLALDLKGPPGLVVGRKHTLFWRDERLWLYALSDPTRHAALIGHTGAIDGVTHLGDDMFVSWSQADRTLRLWDAHKGSGVLLAEGSVRKAFVLGDGALVAQLNTGSLQLWRTGAREFVRMESSGASTSGIRQLSDGRILTWEEGGTLQTWSAHGDRLGSPTMSDTRIYGVEELSDGRILSWGAEFALRIWDPNRISSDAQERSQANDLKRVEPLADGRVLTWNARGDIARWRADGVRDETWVAEHVERPNEILALQDNRFVSASDDHLILLSKDGLVERRIGQHEQTILGTTQLADGAVLSWSADQSFRIWRLDRTPTCNPMRAHNCKPTGALELDTNRILSWGSIEPPPKAPTNTDRPRKPLTLTRSTSAGTVRESFSHGRTNKVVVEVREKRASGLPLDDDAFRPDPPHVAAPPFPDDPHTLLMWRRTDGVATYMNGHQGDVYGARLLRDGRIVSWGADQTMRYWANDGQARTIVPLPPEESITGLIELRDQRILTWNRSALSVWTPEALAPEKTDTGLSHIDEVAELSSGGVRIRRGGGELLLFSMGVEIDTILLAYGILGAVELADGRLVSWDKSKELKVWSPSGALLATAPVRNDILCVTPTTVFAQERGELRAYDLTV